MALYYPDVNEVAMRLTAFLGLAFGVINVLRPLWRPTIQALWEGTILHLPLLITSAYALALTVRRRGAATPQGAQVKDLGPVQGS